MECFANSGAISAKMITLIGGPKTSLNSRQIWCLSRYLRIAGLILIYVEGSSTHLLLSHTFEIFMTAPVHFVTFTYLLFAIEIPL